MSGFQEEGPLKRKLADGAALKEEKRRKFQAKQDRKRQEESKQEDRKAWFQKNASFATLVSETDVNTIERIRHLKNHPDNNDSVDAKSTALAAHLAPYFDIQDRKEGEDSSQSLFIAEGTETVRVLLQQYANKSEHDRIQVKSIFVKPSVLFEKPVHLLEDAMKVAQTQGQGGGYEPDSTEFLVLVGEIETVLSKVAGFPISRGALACGIIPKHRNEAWLNVYLHKKLQSNEGEQEGKCRLLALDGICDTANLGSMIRTASAMGVNAIVLSSDTCDAWYRKSIRVSMGHVFLVPVVRVNSLVDFLSKWNTITSYAAVVQKEESVALHTIPPKGVQSAWCCVFGNEGNGITQPVLDQCTKKIRIEMTEGVDSLSVPIACGILLNGLQEREG